LQGAFAVIAPAFGGTPIASRGVVIMAAHQMSDASSRHPVLTTCIAPNLARGFLGLATDDIHVDARGTPVLDQDFAIDQHHRDISSLAVVHQ